MPKIPVFETQARPTAEVGAVQTNIQVPLDNTLGKIQSLVTDYYVKEKEVSDKAEADKLFIEAQTEIFNAKKKAELKITP